MESLKVCFIGVGSIAKRHIRNLRNLSKEQGIELSINALRRSDERLDGVDNIFCEETDLPFDYDAIFITNPTNKHLDSLRKFHDHGQNFFIEKPVVSLPQIKEALEFPLRGNSVYYVAAPLRYNAVLQWLKANVKQEDVISVRSISSSYLPAWRPGQDYRETYSAHKDMGGGVSIDLIHEWDYLTYLFGEPKSIKSMMGKKSRLEIDSDDYAIYIAEYADKIVELHLDYFGRKTIREIQLFTDEETIVGDIENNEIELLNIGKTIDFHEERDDYQKRELIHFLNMIRGKEETEDGFHHGIKVLELTQGRL